MKKSIFFIIFLICVPLLSSACSQDIARPGQDSVNSAEGAENNKADPGISEEVNLSLWIGYPEFDGWLDNVSKAYMEKHPNVKIEATSYNLRDVETKISTALPAGSGPDIVSIDPTFFLRFIQGGYARKAPQEVIDFVKSDSFDSTIQSFCMEDEVVYGVPTLISAGGIYYNKDMWAEAGLNETDAPKSFEDIRELARKLAKFDEKGNLVRSGISLRLTGGGSGLAEKFWYWLMQEGHSIVKEVSEGKFIPDYCNEAGFRTMKL